LYEKVGSKSGNIYVQCYSGGKYCRTALRDKITIPAVNEKK